MALHAPRPLAVGGPLPANAAVDKSGRLRGDGPRSLRVLLRLSKKRASEPSAAILDSRTLRSTPESGSRGGYDGGHKGKKGSKVHAAVDTLGHLLALRVSPGNEDDRKEGGKLSEEIQQATQENVELAYVDQGYTGERAAEAAHSRGISLEVVKHEEAKRGFVLLPRRWVVERDFSHGHGASSAIGKGLREAARDGGGASPRRVCLHLSSAGSGHH